MKCPTCHEDYATRAGYEAHVPSCAYKDNPLPEPEKEEVKGPSYNELKERAKKLKIEGYSKMKKEELTQAIEEAEAAQKVAELEEQQKAERFAALRIQAEELGIEGFEEMDEESLVAAIEGAAQKGAGKE